jgi:ankyrin repeat protein
MHRSGLPNALEQIRIWHAAFARSDHGEIATAPFTIDDARLAYARQHGLANWSSFVASIADVARDPFSAACEAARHNNEPASEHHFRGILAANPSIVDVRETNGNTLLNLVTAFGNLIVLRELLSVGADPNIANDRGWTPLHQAVVKNSVPMIDALVDAGASATVSAHGDGGTPLAVALLWGNAEATRYLSSVAVVGEVDAMAFLVRRGGDVNADPYRGSALLAATNNAQLDAMQSLLDHGADVNRLATFGGPGIRDRHGTARNHDR